MARTRMLSGRAGRSTVPVDEEREGAREARAKVSRETEDRVTPTDVDVCAIVRRTGFMLRTLLQVWQTTLPDVETPRVIRILSAVEAAADLLVAVYAEPTDDIPL